MPLPKLPKSSITGPLFTRGGAGIGGPLLPELELPIPPDGSVVQNPAQITRQVAQSAGRAAARSGGFGPRSRAAYRQYNDPSINPPSQAPGAPISNRPIVPIEDGRGGGGGFQGVNRPGRPVDRGVPSKGVAMPGPSLGTRQAEFGSLPSASMASSAGTGMRATSMRSSSGVATRGASVAKPTVAVAKTAVAVKPAAAPKATSAVVTGKKVVKKKPIISMA